MIKITEAVSDIVVVRSVHVQLVYLVMDILPNLDILGRGSAALILVGGDIDPERLECGETVPGHQGLRAFPLYQLDALVVVTGAELAPVPSVVEVILPAARVRAHTHVADEAVLEPGPEPRHQGAEEGQQEAGQGQCLRHHLCLIGVWNTEIKF